MPRRAPTPGRRPLLVPLLSAAVVLLLLASGYLLGRVGRLTEGQEQLQRTIALLDARAPAGLSVPGRAVTPGPDLPPASPFGLTVDELQSWLVRQPPDALLLSATEVEAAVDGSLRWRAVLYRARAVGVRTEDGLAAGEALRLLRMLDLDPQRKLPARGAAVPAGSL